MSYVAEIEPGIFRL